MALTEAYYIDGVPMPLPGGGVKLRYSHLESGEAGVDESGFYHRDLLRRGLRSWEIRYRGLTPGAYRALLAKLPQTDSFTLSIDGQTALCRQGDVDVGCRETLQGPVYDLCLTLQEC